MLIPESVQPPSHSRIPSRENHAPCILPCPELLKTDREGRVGVHATCIESLGQDFGTIVAISPAACAAEEKQKQAV